MAQKVVSRKFKRLSLAASIFDLSGQAHRSPIQAVQLFRMRTHGNIFPIPGPSEYLKTWQKPESKRLRAG